MVKFICFKEEDWEYFCTRINWGASFMDAKAITIMNNPIVKEED